jgi:hypothetical protein
MDPGYDPARVGLGRQILTAALVVLVGVTGGLAFRRIRRARDTQQFPRRTDIR